MSLVADQLATCVGGQLGVEYHINDYVIIGQVKAIRFEEGEDGERAVISYAWVIRHDGLPVRGEFPEGWARSTETEITLELGDFYFCPSHGPEAHLHSDELRVACHISPPGRERVTAKMLAAVPAG